MLETCRLLDEQTLARAGALKADLSLGINPQLQEEEAGGSSSSSSSSSSSGEFGVQCPFSAFAQYEGSGMAWHQERGGRLGSF